MTGGDNQSDRALIKRAQSGDTQALEELTARHDPLVKYVAKRFLGRGQEFDDLHQLGRVGLIKAIRNFDLHYDVRFSTYAVPLILGEIRRFLRDDGQIHVSRTIRENAARLKKAMEEDEGAGIDELARRAGIRTEEAVMAMEATQAVRSLEEPASADGAILLKDTLGEDPSAEMVEKLELKQMLSGLGEAERRLILRRYFLEHTQTRIAREMGMSQVQVSRMESRILKRMAGWASGN